MKKRKIERQKPLEQNPEERVKNFNEVSGGLDNIIAMTEASRCLSCKKAPCMQGCPVGVNIPKMIKAVKEGHFVNAYKIILESHGCPQICGRVCPQENQCEGKCILGKKDKPVAIGLIERAAGDIGSSSIDLACDVEPNGKSVAIVGSGPVGIASAFDLAKLGYDVTIFEAFHKPGGVLIYGIPEFRLPKVIVQKEIENLKKLGVKFKYNCPVGKQVSLVELREQFDAVVIGVGAGVPWIPDLPGNGLVGVYSANSYLTRINLMKAYKFPEVDTPVLTGEKVIVLGGGNVAMDAARCARRMGSDVTICYRRTKNELPARAEEVHHAFEEGVKLIELVSPKAWVGDGQGKLSGMVFDVMELGEPDQSGRRRPIATDQQITMDCDLCIVALGTGPNRILLEESPELTLNKKGYIVVDEMGRTNLQSVYSGGDIVTGSATVISAFQQGREIAFAIHQDLSKL